MGFSLEAAIKDLELILLKEQKPKKTLIELTKALAEIKQYAKECGVLK